MSDIWVNAGTFSAGKPDVLPTPTCRHVGLFAVTASRSESHRTPNSARRSRVGLFAVTASRSESHRRILNPLSPTSLLKQSLAFSPNVL